MLIRHAKSSWKSPAASDHDRPLNKRGRRVAPKVAAELKARGWVPDLVLCSDALRAVETWDRMSKVFDAPPVEFLSSLYHCDVQALEAALRGVSGRVETVAVVGHNPGWDAALLAWTGQGVGLKTCDAALLEVGGEAGPGYNLVDVVRARDIA